jgi:hypothetical protein
MPWNPEDAKKHKGGLDEKSSRQWAHVANSVYEKCLADGGDDKSCAPKAIRQANGVTGNIMGVYYLKSKDYQAKERQHLGKKHLIVPVTMMVEGVHNGSHGPLLHKIDELGKFPESWNGIPVVIDHPEVDGQNVSANDPDIIDARTIGRVYRTRVNGKSLKAEVWLDEEKLGNLCPTTLAKVQAGELLEVSVGVFSDDEPTKGDWNGESYESVATNHRPDHLAILPTGTGACSLADGCGIRANKVKVVPCEDKEDEELEVDEKDLSKKDKHKDIQSSLKGDAGVEVSKTITKNKEVNKMSNETKCPRCLEKINALIANEQSKFVETDREWLLTQDEGTLDKLAPVVKEIEKIVEKTVEVNKLSAEDQADLAWAKKMRKEKRETIIKGIQDNTEKGTWDDATLSAMTEDVLERVLKSVKKDVVVDYSVNANVQSNTGGIEPLYPVGVEIKK